MKSLDEPVQFVAALHRVLVDEDGESKVILTVPLSDVGPCVSLLRWLKQRLHVTVRRDPDGGRDGTRPARTHRVTVSAMSSPLRAAALGTRRGAAHAD